MSVAIVHVLYWSLCDPMLKMRVVVSKGNSKQQQRLCGVCRFQHIMLEQKNNKQVTGHQVHEKKIAELPSKIRKWTE